MIGTKQKSPSFVKLKIMSMKQKVLALIAVCILLQLASCTKNNDSDEKPALGYSYFPLEMGQAKYYQVDSIAWLGYTFDPIAVTVKIDTISYQVKEIVTGFFMDNEGRETAKIERYRRLTPSDPWSLLKVLTENITPVKAERYEDNIRYTKLIFPPAENEKWIGQYVNVPLDNSTIEPWEYEYESVNEPGNVGAFYYDSIATVILKNDINLIEFRFYQEQYAAGTGLIFKEYKDLEYLNTTSSFIKNGFIYRETIIVP